MKTIDERLPDGLHERLQAIRASIRQDLAWSIDEDRRVAGAAAGMAPDPRGVRRHLGTELKHRARVAVVGCGPSLDTLRAADVAGAIVIAADGATARLRELSVVPRIVVTDLDGDHAALQWAADAGSILVVHAHGDNGPAIEKLLAALGPLTLVTHQVEAADIDGTWHSAGVTDGDRAAVLAHAFGARAIELWGFDLDAMPGRSGGEWDPATKPRKLAAAGEVVAALAGDGAWIRFMPGGR